MFHIDCKVKFHSKGSLLTITYRQVQRRSTRNHNASDLDDHVIHRIDLAQDLEELKYYVHKFADESDEPVGDDLEVTHFLALRVKKNEKNGLKHLSNAYIPDGNDLKKKFIVVEFRSEKDFDDMRKLMQLDGTVQAFVLEESRLNAHQAKNYCKSLLADSDLERQRRFSAPSLSKTKSGFLAGRGPNDVLLVYPFGVDAKDIDNAADELKELSCLLIPESSSASAASDVVEEDIGRDPTLRACETDYAKLDSSSEKENEVEDPDDKTQEDSGEESRAVLEFSVSTFERLEPGVYLNDTLIDFWCQWYV